MRRLILAMLGTSAIILAPGAATPAGAAPAVASSVRTVSTPHCVDEATPAGISRAVAAPACFATFAKAIAHATNGTVLLPSNATTVTQQQLDEGRARGLARGRLVEVVLGISWLDANFAGFSSVHIGATDCDTNADVDFFLNSLANDNVFSSAKAYGQCQGTYYDLINRPAGSARVSTNWTGGAMDNKSSSIDWV